MTGSRLRDRVQRLVVAGGEVLTVRWPIRGTTQRDPSVSEMIDAVPSLDRAFKGLRRGWTLFDVGSEPR